MAIAALANSISLRQSVLLDGAASGAMGVLLAGGAGILASLFGMPEPFLFWVGLALILWMGALVLIGRSNRPASGAVETVIALNALWVVGSIVFAVADPFGMTALGLAFVMAQALAVTLFADIQFLGLRRAG